MRTLPMSQSDLLLLLPLGWQHYQDHLPRFAEYKDGYTLARATAALAQLEAANVLPTEDAREADAEVTRSLLLEQGREFLDVWQQLEGYIEGAYPTAASYKAMREAAGYRFYKAAANHDWPAMTSLVDMSRDFLQGRKQMLLDQGEMPPTFETRFEQEAHDVQVLLGKLHELTVAAQLGTTARNTALLACYDTFMKMSGDAQRIFRRQPEQARLFQVEYLRSIVSSTGQAGIRGRLTLVDGTPAAGVTVAVLGQAEPVAAVSDADGRYALAVAAGSYTLALSGAGYGAQQLAVVVEAGVKRRVNGVMGK
jgi:hypothetical protein